MERQRVEQRSIWGRQAVRPALSVIRPEGTVAYIGGSDSLPAPLSREEETALFVMAGHSYELEVLDHWDYMEQLLQYIQSFDFEIMTTMEFVNNCYPQK